MGLINEFEFEPLPEGKVGWISVTWSDKKGCIVTQHIVDEYVSTWTKIKRKINNGLKKYKIIRKNIL